MVWDLTVWFAVGLVALIFTAGSIIGLRQNIVGIYVADAAATMLWVLWSIQAFAVEKSTDSGLVIMQHYPSLGYLGLAFAILMALDLFLSVFEAMASEFTGDSNNG